MCQTVSEPITMTEELLIERMRNAGLRLTLPRRAVVRALVHSNGNFVSARTIVEFVLTNAGRIEPSTVYRVLDDLARIGLVHHIPLKGGKSGKWHVTLHHDHEHLVCEFCDKTIAIPNSEFEPLFDLFNQKYGSEKVTLLFGHP